jgi:hypothetical protein
MADADRPGAERVPIPGDLHGEILVFQPMRVCDIGNTGVTVETRFPLHIDAVHVLRLSLGSQTVVVKGRVADSRISGVVQDAVTYQSGLEFVAASDEMLNAIRQYVTTAGGEAAG